MRCRQSKHTYYIKAFYINASIKENNEDGVPCEDI